MPTTAELVHASHEALDLLDQNQWEITPELEARIDELVEASQDKLAAIKHINDRCQSEAELLGNEIQALQARRTAILSVRERVRELGLMLLRSNRELTGLPRVKTPVYTAYIGRTQVVRGPEDPNLWPDGYKTVRVNADKLGALKDLRAGKEIPGLSLADVEYAAFR